MDEEITDLDLEQIAKQIKDGCTGGILDGDGYRVSWNLRMDKFEQ